MPGLADWPGGCPVKQVPDETVGAGTAAAALMVEVAAERPGCGLHIDRQSMFQVILTQQHDHSSVLVAEHDSLGFGQCL